MQRDKWSCGYRNFQMLLGSLQAHRRGRATPCPLFVCERDDGGSGSSSGGSSSSSSSSGGDGSVPSVRMFQRTLENAWHSGYDPAGAAEYNSSVRDGGWVGATECFAVMSYLGEHAHIVDFTRKSYPSGSPHGHEDLVAWVRAYFLGGGQGPYALATQFADGWRTDGSNAEALANNEPYYKPPLYFQYQGHSRNLVGVREAAGGLVLLVLDPGKGSRTTKAIREQNSARTLGVLEVPESQLRHYQYQLVHVLASAHLLPGARSDRESYKNPNNHNTSFRQHKRGA